MLETSDKTQIIAENHASVIRGHKGLTKTYKRIHHNYFWYEIRNTKAYTRMLKLPIEKTNPHKNPTTYDPHGYTALDKISMNIVGPLPIMKADTHIYSQYKIYLQNI